MNVSSSTCRNSRCRYPMTSWSNGFLYADSFFSWLKCRSTSATETCSFWSLTVDVSRLEGVHKATNCRQVLFHIHPKYRVVIAERKSQKPLLCGASPLAVSFGM